jgi:hypothetical protein
VLLEKGINLEQKNNVYLIIFLTNISNLFKIITKDGKRAADMTEEPEMIYLLKDFDKYKRV